MLNVKWLPPCAGWRSSMLKQIGSAFKKLSCQMSAGNFISISYRHFIEIIFVTEKEIERKGFRVNFVRTG